MNDNLDKLTLDTLLNTKAIEVINSIKQEVLSVAKLKLSEISLTEANCNKLFSDIISGSISEDFKVQVKKNLVQELSGKLNPSVKHQTPVKRATKASAEKTSADKPKA